MQTVIAERAKGMLGIGGVSRREVFDVPPEGMVPRGRTAQRIRAPHTRIVEVRWSAPRLPSPSARSGNLFGER